MDMDVLCPFKFDIRSQNMDEGSFKFQRTWSIHDKDAIFQKNPSVLQTPILRLKGHRFSVYLQNKFRERTF